MTLKCIVLTICLLCLSTCSQTNNQAEKEESEEIVLDIQNSYIGSTMRLYDGWVRIKVEGFIVLSDESWDAFYKFDENDLSPKYKPAILINGIELDCVLAKVKPFALCSYGYSSGHIYFIDYYSDNNRIAFSLVPSQEAILEGRFLLEISDERLPLGR